MTMSNRRDVDVDGELNLKMVALGVEHWEVLWSRLLFYFAKSRILAYSRIDFNDVSLHAGLGYAL